MTFLNHKAVNFSSLMTINNIILSSLMTIVKERKGEGKKGGREGEEREDWFYTFKKNLFQYFYTESDNVKYGNFKMNDDGPFQFHYDNNCYIY